MRWLARRPSANASPPQADLVDVGKWDADDVLLGTGELLAAAERFITLFHDEDPGAAAFADRMRQVRGEVKAHGTYRHTPEELTFAARVAWRNSSRCIGRLYWRTLQVRDWRQVSAADQIAAGCFTHLREATNGGRIRPLITQPPGLPRARFDLPADTVLEVPLRHPELTWFGALGLRWYAVPVISDMYLEAGGIRYPAAPFNGWYMCTEIGSRDLGDEGRYNQLPEIAARMGLSTDSPRTLWKDRAVTELNVAVLHSYETSGVKIADHHTESERFLAHVEKEQQHGRRCPADWTWIVPPTAGSTTPVFHHYYDDFDASPNFYRHAS